MTLGEMIAQIQDDWLDTRVTQQQIIDGINESIDYYKRMTFYFTDALINFTMKVNQEYYDENDNQYIPNIFNINYLSVVSNGFTGNLSAVTDDAIQYAQNNGITNPLTNTPYAYAYVRQQIRIFPIPTAHGTFSVSATEKTLTLTNTRHTNSWLTEAPELIRSASKVRIALNKFNDSDLAAGPAALEQKELSILLAETRKRQSQVPLRVDNGLTPIVRSNYNHGLSGFV